MADRLKVMMKPMNDGQLTPMLCFPDGTPLPGQTSVDIRTRVDSVAEVTVSFVCIEFAEGD